MCQGHRRFLGLSRRQTVRSRKQTHPATAGPSACACPAALNQAADTTPKSQNRPTTGLVRAGPDPAAVATTFAPIAPHHSKPMNNIYNIVDRNFQSLYCNKGIACRRPDPNGTLTMEPTRDKDHSSRGANGALRAQN